MTASNDRGEDQGAVLLNERVRVLSRERTRAIQEWTAAEQQAAERQVDAQRHADWVQELLLQLDEVRGVVRAVESVRRDSSLEDIGWSSEDADIVEWVRSVTVAGTQLQIENRSLNQELAAVDAHRQQLAQDLVAVCSSQSWRLGYALTWPIRALPTRQRRARRASPDPRP